MILDFNNYLTKSLVNRFTVVIFTGIIPEYMKKILLAGGLLLFSLVSVAQDTTWVQTFTFDSISTRRANFQFPASLDTSRFEKVLMYYKLKCSPLTPWDQYNCGEWDYLTYTHVYDHTGIFDSVRVDGNKFKVYEQVPATYSYSLTPYFDQQYRSVQRRTAASSMLVPVSGTTGGSFAFARSNNGGAKMQWIVSAAELANAGIVAGDLNALQLNFLNAFGQIEGVIIKIKHTSLNALTTWESTGFTTVYDDDVASIANGANTFYFGVPFNYDGAQNIIVEVSYLDAHIATSNLNMETQTLTGSSGLYMSNSNGMFHTTTNDYAELNVSNFDLGGDVTIQFWAKGSGSFGTNTSILEAVDSLNNRVINIHFPWSDNNVYFDAGQGSSYDRINKIVTATDIDNNWHHWAFVKKTSTGQMFVYKDGVQWHTGTNKNLPIGKIAKFYLGSNRNQQYQYQGDIDEFSIIKNAVSATDISTWMNKKIDNSHPNYTDLVLYYDFDGQNGMVDKSGNNRHGMTSTPGMIISNSQMNAGTEVLTEVPTFAFDQGTANTATTDSVLSAINTEISVKFNYTASDNSFHIVSNELTYPLATIDTFSVNGTVLNSGPSAADSIAQNTQITYYETPFEKINDVEIGRYITPYGIGFDLGPQGFNWIYDVTDYQKYLHGTVDFAAGNTQELLDVKFVFVHGIPARDVHNIQPVWQNYKSLNFAQMATDVVLADTAITLSDTSSMFKIKTRLSGHGQVGNGACCEWVPNDHKILIDGVERFNWNIWRPDACGENPNIGQGGTWPYAREGWCPGDLVPEYEHEITPFVSGGDTVHIDYDITDVPANDPGQAGGNYIVAIDLVSYSAPNFQYDMELKDILNPNSYEYYSKWNPTCSNPRVIIKNNGSEEVTSAKIRIWVNYGNFIDYVWTGSLNFLEETVVEIPITDNHFWFAATPSNGFFARIIEVNGSFSLDEYAQNNEFKTIYTAPEVITGPFYVWFTTNNKANENKWKLIDQAGNIIFQRLTLTNTTDYKDTFDLAPGCYSIILEDSDDDGIGFWYSAQTEGETTGGFRVRKVGGSMYEIFPADFGSYHRYDFSVGFGLGLDENDFKNELNAFPNPATNKVHVEYIGNIGETAQIDIVDMNGRVIKTTLVLTDNATYTTDFDLSDVYSGYYLIRVSGMNGSQTVPFVKQ